MRCRNLSRNALLSYSATRGEEQLETVHACGGWGSSLEKRCVGMSSVTLVIEEVVHLSGSVHAWGGVVPIRSGGGLWQSENSSFGAS